MGFTVGVAFQKGHTLTTGLFRFIRHFSYTGAILTLIGWALVFRSLIGVGLAVMMALLLAERQHGGNAEIGQSPSHQRDMGDGEQRGAEEQGRFLKCPRGFAHAVAHVASSPVDCNLT